MMRVSFTLALATSFASSVSAKGMRGGSNPNPSMDSIYDDDMMKTMHGEEGSGMHDYGYDYGGEAEGSGMHYGNDEEKFKDYDLPGNEGHGSGMQHYTLDEDGKDHAAYGKKMLREPQICSDTEKCRDGLSCCMWENNLGSNAATGFCREMCKMGGKKERPKGDGMKDDKHKWNDDAMEHENDDEHKWNDDAMEHENDDEHKWKDDAMEHENDDEHKWKDEEEHKWKDEEEHKWKDAGVLPATPNRPVLAVRDTVPNTVPLPSKMNINQNNNKLRTQAPVAPKVLEALSASITLEGTTEQMLLESFAMQRSILEGYADATQIDASMIKISKIGRNLIARRLQEKDSEDDAKKFASDAKNKATAAAHAVGGAVHKAANSSVWGEMHDGAKDAASATGGALKAGATTAANGIRSGYKAAANSSIWGDVHDGAKNAASATGSAAKTGAIAAGGAISSGATSAANSIKSLWDSATFEPLKVHFIITLGSGASLQDVERVQNQVQGATPSDVQRAILKKAMTEAPNFEVSEFQITAVSSAVAPGTQREDTVLGRIAAAGGVDKATVAGAVVGAFLVVIAIALWCCCKKSKKTKEARAGQGPVSVGNLEKRLDVANHGHAMKL